MSSDSSPEQPQLENDSTLRVDKSVSLTIGSDSLLIVGESPVDLQLQAVETVKERILP